MSLSHQNVENFEPFARNYDLSFDILLKLKSEGKTTAEIMDMFTDVSTCNSILTCLENLWRIGLIFRIRSGKTYEWWANGVGIANAAFLLSDCAAVIPKRDLKTIFALSEQNAFISRVAGFFSVAGRVDILQAVLYRPMAMQEIFERISLQVSPSKLVVLLQTIEKLGLISSNVILVRKEVGGFNSKKYKINRKGIIVLDALRGFRPIRDVLKVGEQDKTVPW